MKTGLWDHPVQVHCDSSRRGNEPEVRHAMAEYAGSLRQRLREGWESFCGFPGKLALGLLLVWLLRQWVWAPVLIVGHSMEPTLRSGQIAAISKLAYRFGAPRRGDIVAVWTGRDLIMKRIVGLPGDEVCVRDGRFSVNGTPLEEPYVQLHDGWNIAAGTIGQNRFVIAGDNRSGTLVAVVHRSRIVGRLIGWPGTARGSRLAGMWHALTLNEPVAPGQKLVRTADRVKTGRVK